uniref:gasdermin-E-like n=1 Tax=Centroberyx gerrardi TaxID=166262 RepID=UPI003AACF34D
MFSKATGNFVRQIDPEGSLIHVSRLIDSHKLLPMALVVKRNRFWFWQRPKYQPMDFTLSDLLLGDEPLSPAVSETDFLTYQGTFGDMLSGKLGAKAGVVSINLEGRGSSKLQSSFGKLKKQEVNVKMLLRDSNDRLMNMQHVLVQQLEKRADVLAVLKERILTTSPCSVTETCQEQGTCGGVLSLVGKLGNTVEVCVKDSNNIQADSDVSLEIPPGTVIAYSLLELEIKKDGHYELCLQPGTLGGFESDSGTSSPSHDSFDTLCVVDGLEWIEEKVPERAPLSALQNELQQLEVCLSPLAQLPQATRSALFQQLHETIRDRASLSDLEHMLEQWCRSEAPVMELSVSQSNSVSAVLDLLTPGPDNHIENGGPGVPAYLTAAHLLVSAMEVFPDETLSLLSECSADFLEDFNTLISRLKGSCQPLPVESLPIPLQDDRAFQLAEQLLRSANVTLRRETDGLWAETGNKPGVLPLVLCVAIHGLSSLCHGQN